MVMANMKDSKNTGMRNVEKIQLFPPHMYYGYNKPTNQLPKMNKTSNQLPKVTKTIMSPLTTMPPKKIVMSPTALKPKPNMTTQNVIKPEDKKPTENKVLTEVQPKIESKPEVKAVVKNPVYRPDKISLEDVHPFITCFICRGYLIEATTIVECLHTYCHSCLIKHLIKEKNCPQCGMSINKSKTNIKYDATIQSTVYKLVPGLYQKEVVRRRAFYRQRPEEAKYATPEERGDDTEHLILSPMDLISLSLEYAEKETLKGSDDNESIQNLLTPKYLNCPAVFKVEHLKKFIVSKFCLNVNKFNVEISYKVKAIVLPEHYTIMDVAYIYTWKKEAPMPFFFRIIAKNSKCDELPEVALRRSPTTTLPNLAEDFSSKKKSVSFNDKVESIEPAEPKPKSNHLVKLSPKLHETHPKVESIKLKLDASNNNISIVKKTPSTSEEKPSYHSKHSDSHTSHKQDAKLDEFDFKDDIDEQKLGFLNAFQLTAKRFVNLKSSSSKEKSPSSSSKEKSPGPSYSIKPKPNVLPKKSPNTPHKRKNKEPIKTTTKKYKFHDMNKLAEGNKFVFTKTGDGHEITFDMAPKALGSKPSLSSMKNEILQAQKRADAKLNQEMQQNLENRASSATATYSKPATKPSAPNTPKVPIAPATTKKLPMLLPKQPAFQPIVQPSPPSEGSPAAFVIKKPQEKQTEISVTKIEDQHHHFRIYGPKSQQQNNGARDFKAPDGFVEPLPPKAKPSNSLPVPKQILKPYGSPIKMPKNIPENMQTPYGCRTPFYVPSSPSYTPNFEPKPQFKYANPNAYASFMESMLCASSSGKNLPPVNTNTNMKSSLENNLKRPSSDISTAVPIKRKSPTQTKSNDTGSKSTCILNKINFPSSLSVTLTNEQEESKKEQLRNTKQNIVNNNIEIIKLSEESNASSAEALSKSLKYSPVEKRTNSEKKTDGDEKKVPNLPPLIPNPHALMQTPIAKAFTDLKSSESFQRAFLKTLVLDKEKANADKSQAREKSKEKDDKRPSETKTEGQAPAEHKPLISLKSFCKMPDDSSSFKRKSNSLTPPLSKPLESMAIEKKCLTPPLLSSEAMFPWLIQAQKHLMAFDYANALLAMQQQLQQQQQHKMKSQNNSSPSSSNLSDKREH